MKKIISTILASLLLIGTLTACGESGKQPDVNEIADKVLKEVEIPSAVKKEVDDFNIYYEIDTALVSDGVLYICGSGAYPDELAIFKMKTADDAKNAKESVDKRLATQITLFESYTPDEMYKLEGAKIIVKSNYLFFVATEDNSKVEEIINSFF